MEGFQSWLATSIAAAAIWISILFSNQDENKNNKQKIIRWSIIGVFAAINLFTVIGAVYALVQENKKDTDIAAVVLPQSIPFSLSLPAEQASEAEETEETEEKFDAAYYYEEAKKASGSGDAETALRFSNNV